jgi:hypothetical protein
MPNASGFAIVRGAPIGAAFALNAMAATPIANMTEKTKGRAELRKGYSSSSSSEKRNLREYDPSVRLNFCKKWQ